MLRFVDQEALNDIAMKAAGVVTDNPVLYGIAGKAFNAITGADENDIFALGKVRVGANLLQRFASGRGLEGMVVTKEEGKSLYEAFTNSFEIDPNDREYPNIPTTNIGGQAAMDENTAAGFKPYSGNGGLDANVGFGFGRFWATKPGKDGAIIVKDQFDGVGESRKEHLNTLDVQDVIKQPTRLPFMKGAKNKPIPIKWKIFPDGTVEMLD